MIRKSSCYVLVAVIIFHVRIVKSEIKLRVAVIGAGASGLVSAKHALANGFDCELLEAAPQIGGTWVYTDDVGVDKYGYPIYTAMYKGLRTNLPNEVMNFPDLASEPSNSSYVSQKSILNYLNKYADKFDIKRRVKFNRVVTNVIYINEKWVVTSVDKISNSTIKGEYDAVIVCNGHTFQPFTPLVEGISKFSGKQLHSHQYRFPEPFRNSTILIIGSGPSGIDITSQLSKVASKIIFSHHRFPIKFNFSENVDMEPDVLNVVNETHVRFTDGSIRFVDTIIYCTGYTYSFPFIDESVGLTVERYHVKPLYKHMIHISNPKLCFIGIPSIVLYFRMIDIQARFYIQYLNGKMDLPSQDEMFEDTRVDLLSRMRIPRMKSRPHALGIPLQNKYFSSLSKLANISTVPKVLIKVYEENFRSVIRNIHGFREDRYEIINNETFIKF